MTKQQIIDQLRTADNLGRLGQAMLAAAYAAEVKPIVQGHARCVERGICMCVRPKS